MPQPHDRKHAPPVFEPALADWPDTGVYQLWLEVSVGLRLRVGRLGRVSLEPGVYVYTGRASRGLRARVLRHARGARRRHWHIDYLLARAEVRLLRVRLAAGEAEAECAVNKAVPGGECVLPGFGSSDCRRGCGSHLRYVPVALDARAAE
ncbi:MAG: DUF123 domain-containing protein [Phycisphaerae bacterium]|jgi:Uri superfamily endonuclease